MHAIARIKPRSSRRCAPRTARRSRSGRSIWPHSKQTGTKRACYSRPVLVYYIGKPDGVVAQLVRAFASHARGRGFEPRQPHHCSGTHESECFSFSLQGRARDFPHSRGWGIFALRGRVPFCRRLGLASRLIFAHNSARQRVQVGKVDGLGTVCSGYLDCSRPCKS